ncbi:hypothetical protein EBX31_12340, partial [bacterium]|nr:hypothetical protein [bacterium]
MGSAKESHVGLQLQKAASRLAVSHGFLDTELAHQGWRLMKTLAWRTGRRPVRLITFSKNVRSRALTYKPRFLLSTGMAPICRQDLRKMKEHGIKLLNYSTDDPWSLRQKASWFLKALPEYNRVFSTRRANLGEFSSLGIKASHLPFGYDPELYFPDDGGLMPDVRRNEEAKVFLAGGGDVDR